MSHPTTNAKEAEVDWFYEDIQYLELTHTHTHTHIHIKGVFFIIVDWNANVESQERSGVTGKFGLGEQIAWLTDFCQENTLVIVNTLFI